ncbi:hypothetical protein PSGK_19060 [Pseudomonas solani]|uniref:hypothetical protein n=1 Tax=Pseudomonas solani TaxID=2731552 RepID=UPI0035BE9E58
MKSIIDHTVAIAALVFLTSGAVFFLGELSDRGSGLQRVNSNDITCVYRGRSALQCWPEVSEPQAQDEAMHSNDRSLSL